MSTPETSEEATSPVDTDSTETVGTAGETASSAAAVEAAGDAAPTDAAPTDAAPTDAVPTDAVPTDVAPADAVSAEGGPTYATPSDAAPSDDLDAGEEIEEPPAPLDSDDELDAVCEALLLVVDTPIHEDSLAHTLGQTGARVLEALQRLSARYTDANSGIDLRRIGDGWRFYTRDIYAPYVEKLLLDGQRAKLTRAALETLAVIAYRQPVTRSRVAAVRGVNVDGVMRTLLARGLVEEVGTDTDTQGTLYRTTELFLERIGLSTLDDLPPIAPLLPEVDSIDDVI